MAKNKHDKVTDLYRLYAPSPHSPQYAISPVMHWPRDEGPHTSTRGITCRHSIPLWVTLQIAVGQRVRASHLCCTEECVLSRLQGPQEVTGTVDAVSHSH